MVGQFVRPWAGEKLIGEVIVVEGDFLHCRSLGGFEFWVALEDVRSGKARAYHSLAAVHGGGSQVKPWRSPVQRFESN